MIQKIITYEGSRCGSPDLVKNGHDYKGVQKYYRKTCVGHAQWAKRRYAPVCRPQIQRARIFTTQTLVWFLR